MAINFSEELIRVEYVIGEETVTESISGTITIPDGDNGEENKPPAERIIDVKEFGINNLETTIEEGGVDITGDIEIGITYVGSVTGDDVFRQPVHFVEGELHLANFVDIPEAEPGMNVFVDINVRRLSFEQVDVDEGETTRDIEVTVIIQKFVKVTEYRQITVITDVTGIPQENINEELLRIEDVIGENTVTVIISGELDDPEDLQKPPIERILSTTAEIEGEVETEITADGVIIDGDIFAGVMYVGIVTGDDVWEQPVHFLEDTFHFTETVDVPGAEEGMNVHTDLTIQKVSYDEILDDDGNIERVEVDVILRMFVKVTEPKQVTVVTDIISDLVELDRELLRVEDVVGEDTVHETTTQRFIIPDEKPPAQRIIETKGRIVEREVTIEPGGVLLDMLVEGSIVYVGAVTGDDVLRQPVHFYHDTFPYDNFIDIPGAEEGMNTHVEVEVTKATAELVNLNEAGNTTRVDITLVLRKFAKVTEFRQLEIVTDIIVVSPAADGECPPSYVVYIVQSGDTLYKISRRYRTTVDALIQANPDINPNNLQIGQKICVPNDIMGPTSPRG